MPIRVDLDGPPRNALGAVLVRGGSFVAGSVLRVLALTAVWPVIALTVGATWWMFGSEPDRPPGSVVPLWLIAVVVTGAMSVLGSRLQAGNRRMVLYLRRFGDTDATGTVTAAVARIGGYWRVVTLDDGRVTALGARGSRALDTAERWGRGGHSVVTKTWGTIAAVLLLAFWATVGLTLTDHREVFDRVVAWVDEYGPAGHGKVPVSVAWLVFGMCGVGLALEVVRLALAPFTTAVENILRSFHVAERGKVLRIVDEASIQNARRRIAAQARKVISARLFVLRVDTPVWQRTVTEFGTDAELPLIDITEPTENILWEIDRMRARFGRRCVFVGRYERLGHLFVIPEPGSLTDRLQQRLDGCRILAYRTGRRGARQFARALRATLETQARPVRRSTPASA